MKLYTADAIKEQVHKLLCQDCGETEYCPKCDYRELIEQILDAPTVDAEPVRHGRWYSVENYMGTSRTVYVCSECGSMSNRKDNYCWYCGAKMDGGKE